MAAAPVGGVVFTELIGLNRMRGLETSEEAWDWLATVVSAAAQAAARTRPGLSPHAPYSTAGWLFHKAAASRLPLSTHLAEMPEEIELLRHRAGPLRDVPRRARGLGRRLGADRPPARRLRPPRQLKNADWLIAHGTYFDPSEFWQLRPRGRTRQPAGRDRFLPADARPVRPRPTPVSRHARARRHRLPGDRQPGVEPDARHP